MTQRFGTHDSSGDPHDNASTHGSIPPLVNDDEEAMPQLTNSDDSDIEVVANKTSGTCRNETRPRENDDHDEPPGTSCSTGTQPDSAEGSAMLDAVMNVAATDGAADTAPATSPSALADAAGSGSSQGPMEAVEFNDELQNSSGGACAGTTPDNLPPP